MGRFDGATVLITGAAGGLGRGAAKGFAAEGARLVLSDIDDKALADLAGSLQTETAILAGNIADEKLSEDLVKLAAEKFGRLDIAINNAGIVQSFVRLPQVASDEARRVLEIDLLGVFYAMKHQIPQMERQFKATARGGAIVNIASVAGLVGISERAAYNASKHGLIGLTRTLAAEWGPRGVRTNAVCPGWVKTEMDATDQASGHYSDADITSRIPMGRFAYPDDVANAVAFLADPRQSGFINGAAITVDGGWTSDGSWQRLRDSQGR